MNIDNLPTYADLLAEHQPKSIQTKREYQRLLKIAESLVRPDATKAEISFLELLSDLIEKYEAQHFPIPSVSPGEMLEHLIESKEISKAEFARQVGLSRQLITDIIKGRASVTAEHMRTFGKFFKISPAVFLAKDLKF